MKRILFAILAIATTSVVADTGSNLRYDYKSKKWIVETPKEEASIEDVIPVKFSIGGFARGGLTVKLDKDLGGGDKSGEAYGAEADLLFAVAKKDDFTLWTGLGLSWAPQQEIVSDSGYLYGYGYYNGVFKLGYEELRLLVEPQYNITDNWSIGLRAGLALDLVHMKGNLDSPYVYMWGRRTTCIVQGLIGVKTSYMFTKEIGVYAAVDYRGGSSADFVKFYGQKILSMDMNGWYASAGLQVQF